MRWVRQVYEYDRHMQIQSPISPTIFNSPAVLRLLVEAPLKNFDLFQAQPRDMKRWKKIISLSSFKFVF